MSHPIQNFEPRVTSAQSVPAGHSLPRWVSVVLALSVTSIYVGLVWDISWHMTIGRDTFWTPAHIAIYLGGAVPGLICGGLALRTTWFGSAAQKAHAVVLWGGRAPLGAWIVIWGALAMLTAGPFDDWWHNAYGLDVKIISPPHVVLFVGVFAVVIGTLVFLAREMNSAATRPELPSILFCSAAGVFTGLFAHLFFNEGFPNRQHGSQYYYLMGCIYPAIFTVVTQVSRIPWGATRCAFSYLVIMLLMIWILPRFAAVPKLGPVLNAVDRMVPPYFPHLLIVPAFFIDLLNQRVSPGVRFRRWLLILPTAVLFVTALVAVQWPFSRFLLSPAARNPIFAGGQSWPYNIFVGEFHRGFWAPFDLFNAAALAKICGAAAVSVAVGTMVGSWMKRVIR
jgi:hypothetical protein